MLGGMFDIILLFLSLFIIAMEKYNLVQTSPVFRLLLIFLDKLGEWPFPRRS